MEVSKQLLTRIKSALIQAVGENGLDDRIAMVDMMPTMMADLEGVSLHWTEMSGVIF